MDFDYITDYNNTKNYQKSKGTIRKCYEQYRLSDYGVSINRPHNNLNYPVTEIDYLLDENNYCLNNPYKQFYSLRKNKLFDNFINEIEELAVNRTESMDKKNNWKIITYQVPAFEFIEKPEKLKYQGNCSFTGDYICIGEKGYYNAIPYTKSTNGFVKLNVPKTYFNSNNSLLNTNEQSYCTQRTVLDKTNNTFTLYYHHDIPINCICIYPEKLKFNLIHGNNHHCSHNCSNLSHCIQVLANNPGYICKFNLLYRSTSTNNKWISHGTFTGCSNIYEPVKVYFDEIIVNEIKIVPIEINSSISKCKIVALGPVNFKQVVSKDIVVEYKLYMPLSGKHTQTQVTDNYSSSPSRDFKIFNNKQKISARKSLRSALQFIDL